MKGFSTELKAAETLLDIGVPFVVKAPMFFRLFFIKTIRFTLKNPYMGTSIRAASLYLKAQKLGVDAENMTEALKVREKTAFLIARSVAMYILRGKLFSWLFSHLVAYWLVNGTSEKTLLNIMNVLIANGVNDFMSTIRLTAHLNMMKPNLSPMEQRS